MKARVGLDRGMGMRVGGGEATERDGLVKEDKGDERKGGRWGKRREEDKLSTQ